MAVVPYARCGCSGWAQGARVGRHRNAGSCGLPPQRPPVWPHRNAKLRTITAPSICVTLPHLCAGASRPCVRRAACCVCAGLSPACVRRAAARWGSSSVRPRWGPRATAAAARRRRPRCATAASTTCAPRARAAVCRRHRTANRNVSSPHRAPFRTPCAPPAAGLAVG